MPAPERGKSSNLESIRERGPERDEHGPEIGSKMGAEMGLKWAAQPHRAAASAVTYLATAWLTLDLTCGLR
ncbi:hypothetical protein NL676_030132 [Syzygium grande]|nr:hypothetical protein NL676_030132 [Syzygium grande]